MTEDREAKEQAQLKQWESTEGEMVKLKDAKNGEFVRLKVGAKKTYIKREYDRSQKRYIVDDCDDVSRARWIKGETLVHIGFTY